MKLNDIGIEVIDGQGETEQEIGEKYIPNIWLDEKKKLLDENVFAKYFCEVNKVVFVNGLFYTKGGRVTQDEIERDIWQSIEKVGVATDVERKVKKLAGAVRLCAIPDENKPFVIHQNLLPFANGTLDINTSSFYLDKKEPYPYRFEAPLIPEYDLVDAPNFVKWLHDLFMPDDVETIQQFLGYCLVPSTKAQKSLFLVGEGGAGKSVLGVILQEMLGRNAMMSVTSTQDFLRDKFKMPELENKLVLYDDDLSSDALESTGIYKKLITNNLDITVDRKFGQPFTMRPQIKLVCCCNEMLTSVYDQTDGFYRRLLPVLVKPIADDFVPDLNFYDKITKEIKIITLWALEGLYKLIKNDWVIPISVRTQTYLNDRRSLGNHFPEFMADVFEFIPSESVSIKDIIKVYQTWCQYNACNAVKDRTLQSWLVDNQGRYKIARTEHALSSDQVRTRGYSGLKIRSRWLKN